MNAPTASSLHNEFKYDFLAGSKSANDTAFALTTMYRTDTDEDQGKHANKSALESAHVPASTQSPIFEEAHRSTFVIGRRIAIEAPILYVQLRVAAPSPNECFKSGARS